jgi:hypothetical protein
MNTHPGMFVVANYEIAQPIDVAWDMTPYCWVVETTYRAATDDKAAFMVADLAGHPGKKRHRQLYFEPHTNGQNHVDAALAFMRAFILPSGKDARLVSMANTSKGMLFVFL